MRLIPMSEQRTVLHALPMKEDCRLQMVAMRCR